MVEYVQGEYTRRRDILHNIWSLSFKAFQKGQKGQNHMVRLHHIFQGLTFTIYYVMVEYVQGEYARRRDILHNIWSLSFKAFQ